MNLQKTAALLFSSLAIGIALIFSLIPGNTWADSPAFHPGEAVWPDTKGVPINAHGGGFLFHDGIYYWFGEHKVDGKAGDFAQVGIHVYSSRDLYSWKDEGIALSVSNDPKSEITKGCIMERPKVLYNAKSGKFVMWFHLEFKGKNNKPDYSAARVGVAISDAPTGPYQYLRSFRLNAGIMPKNELQGGNLSTFHRDFTGGQMSRDMTLFQDDDGSAYIVTSSEDNQTLQIAKLTDDYLGCSGEYVRALPGLTNEAPAMFKHRGKYFLITSGTAGWKPCDARLATADAVLGDWVPLGNPCRGTDQQKKLTFESQSTFVLPVAGKNDAFIFIADRWRAGNPLDKPHLPIDRRYVWLPIQWDRDGLPYLTWQENWNLDFFKGESSPTH